MRKILNFYPSCEKKTSNYLVISIYLNILFLCLGSLFVARKLSLLYLSSKEYSTKTIIQRPSPYLKQNYENQLNQFELIKTSKNNTIFLGDSITDFGRWTELFKDLNIENRGIAGDTTIGILNRLDKVIDAQPKKNFLMIGINDLDSGKPLVEISKNYRTILTKIKDKTPKTKVFVQSVLPVNYYTRHTLKANNKDIALLNLKIQGLAQEFSYQYVDLFHCLLNNSNELSPMYSADGLHLNGRGYLVWKKKIEKYVTD